MAALVRLLTFYHTAARDEQRACPLKLDGVRRSSLFFELNDWGELMIVDLVYTRVNPDDRDLSMLRARYAGKVVHDDAEYASGPARTRDNGELRNSLRLADKFAPFIRRIFIVGAGYTPAWISELGPRVTYIEQDELIPPEVAPLFQSDAVEAFVHRIPGLSENYVYCNDDYFFAKPHTASDFFDSQGRSLVTVTPRPLGISNYSTYRKSEENAIRALRKRMILPPYKSFRPSVLRDRRLRRLREDIARRVTLTWRGLPMVNNISHVSQPFSKAAWKGFHQLFQPELSRLVANRFRSDASIPVNIMYHYYANNLGVAKLSLSDEHRTLNRDKSQAHRDRLRRELRDPSVRITRFCLNDNPSHEDDGWAEYCASTVSELLAR